MCTHTNVLTQIIEEILGRVNIWVTNNWNPLERYFLFHWFWNGKMGKILNGERWLNGKQKRKNKNGKSMKIFLFGKKKKKKEILGYNS